MGRRLGIMLVAGLVLAGSWTVSGALGKANLQNAKLSFTEKDTEAPTGLKASIKFTNAGQSANPDSIAVTTAKGTVTDLTATESCTVVTPTPDTCPAGSLLGDGNFKYTGSDTNPLAFVNVGDEIHVYISLGGGSWSELTSETEGRTTTVTLLGIPPISVKYSLDKITDGDAAFLRTPDKCPGSGKWTFKTKVSYSNDSKETDSSKSKC